MQYRLGVWLVGVPDAGELEGYTGMLRTFARYAKPLWVGSLLTGGMAAALAYGLVTLVWRGSQRRDRGSMKPRPPQIPAERSGDEGET